MNQSHVKSTNCQHHIHATVIQNAKIIARRSSGRKQKYSLNWTATYSICNLQA